MSARQLAAESDLPAPWSLRPVRGAAASSGTALGVAAALVAATIWGGALAMTRLGVAPGGALDPHDITMLRFLGPAFVLLPVLLRAAPRLRGLGVGTLLALLAGGGAPFVLVAGMGLRTAQAAEAGALLPGTVPLCVALLSAVALGERFGPVRLLGLALISLSVALVAGPSLLLAGAEESWGGHLLLLGAAMLAAGYTVALRRAGLGAWEAAALVSVGSVLAFGPVYLLALEPQLLAAPWHEVALQATCQGVVSGLLAPVAFAVAIGRLGAARAAAFGGLSPAAATLIGVPLLGEAPDVATAAAVVIAGLGVVLVCRRR